MYKSVKVIDINRDKKNGSYEKSEYIDYFRRKSWITTSLLALSFCESILINTCKIL